MKQMNTWSMATLAILFLALLVVIPVSAADTTNSTTATTTIPKPAVSATTSSTTVTVGDPMTITGVATGGNLTAGVQIWVFAGNYVNVTTTSVNSKGEFSKLFTTAGLPPATYYIFIQSPGNDGRFDINTPQVTGYTSQVMNTKTGAVIFNFTGTGSVQDAAAAQKLSEALNQQGIDDVYTKLTLQLVAPAGTTTAATSVAVTTPPVSAAPTTAKSPVSPLVALAGIGIACLAVVAMKRK